MGLLLGIHKLQDTLDLIMREEQILAMVKEGKGLHEIVSIIYAGLAESLIPYAERTVEAHLKKLKVEQRI